jgi:RNA polymerase sigma-70 factor (ECF subfamily)
VSDPLLAALAEGREDAFAALYDRYGRSLFRVAWTLLRSRPDAEDAVQEVFLGLVRSRSTIARVENLRAYLFSALRHAAARLAARQPPAAAGAAAAANVPAPGEPDTELSGPLSRALAALPLPQREVVTLKVDGDLTFAEIAAVLGISLNTAASRYRYALEKLRALLDRGHHATRPTSPGPR